MIDDFDRCYRALQSKDARFDGWFVTCVTSTGIYCRPSCPAMLPKPQNVRFLPTAAAAQEAGFRACKRCRPDASPGSPEWDVRADLVARAMRCIADGVVDREGVSGLANRLGYGVRQLQRQLRAEVGAGPLALARAQRAQTARVLIETTALDFASVAWGAGFQSVRQFNATVQEVFATTPSSLRERARKRDRGAPPVAGAIDLRLPLREPFNAEGVFAHLVATMVPGVEEYVGDTYRRALRLPHGHGIVELVPAVDHVRCRLRLADLRDLTAAVNRCRRLLDLDADPVAVDAHLSLDDTLAPLVTKAPGRRVPRSVDPAELAIRAVLGQQVSTRSARTHTARLVLACGEPLASADGGLTHCFPEAAAIADADETALAMPASRTRTVRAVASALADGSLVIDESCDRAELTGRLTALPGIGPWTAATIAIRAAGDPDAFLAGDLGVVTAARLLDLPTDAPGLLAHAERWRPWRSYAVQYLWGALDHEISHPRRPARRPPRRPARLKREDVMHTYVIPESPVGTLTLAADDDDRLCRLEFGEWSPRARAAEIVRVGEADGVIAETLRELDEYFAGTRREFDVPLAPHGTQFQLSVWDALRAIPYGETTSYGEIARSVGRPNAVRAVGQANGRNPIAIIVPCHRVIGSDRSLTGYGGGIERKQYLLSLEGSVLTPALDL